MRDRSREYSTIACLLHLLIVSICEMPKLGTRGCPSYGSVLTFHVPLCPLQRLQQQERQRDAEWDRQRELAARAAMQMEEQEQNFRAQLKKSLDDCNHELADAQKAK